MRACLEHGVAARGIEPDAARVAEARSQGLPVEAGDAAALPHGDGSWDWVTLRHVAHHLERPREAFSQAWRVARSGLLVAEPWYDPQLDSQRAGLAIDRFLKRLDRRRGVFHGDVLCEGELLALLPERPGLVEVETHSPALPWTDGDLEREVRHSCSRGHLTPSEARELEAHRGRVGRAAVTLAGTLILTLRRGASEVPKMSGSG